MSELISLLASPEEALVLKASVATSALADPISGLCERSISLCCMFDSCLSSCIVANNDVANLAWQLQGNADLLNLYLQYYLSPVTYSALLGLVIKIGHLSSDIIVNYADLTQPPRVLEADIAKLVIRIKSLFAAISTYCDEIALLEARGEE